MTASRHNTRRAGLFAGAVLAATLWPALVDGPCAAVLPAGQNTVDRDVERVRKATAPFKSIEKAIRAGYSRDGGNCLEHQPHGAMGYHHANQALLDDRIEVERPEILVYERLPNGDYRLNGVEYIVPFSARPETAQPPTVMGQPLKPHRGLQIWYLHVWIWTENPSGLFADWNPRVACDG